MVLHHTRKMASVFLLCALGAHASNAQACPAGATCVPYQGAPVYTWVGTGISAPSPTELNTLALSITSQITLPNSNRYTAYAFGAPIDATHWAYCSWTLQWFNGCGGTVAYTPGTCPANSTDNGTACTCNTGYQANVSGTQCVNEVLTITIEPANPLSTLAQNGLTVEPESMLALKAVVKNQSGVAKADVKVDLKVEVKANTGGHDHHDANRPKGDVTCAPLFSGCGSGSVTDSNGEIAFIFLSPAPAGEHTITATCDLCSSPATADVKVMVEGLSQIPASPFYTLNETTGEVIGARAGWHTDNHNLNADAQAALLLLAERYRKKFPNDLVLHLNDASLPWGGVYDICARPGACSTLGIQLWVKPHAEHRRGTVIDIRANNAAGAIPAANQMQFETLINYIGMSYLHESQGSSNEHYHIRLLGRGE